MILDRLGMLGSTVCAIHCALPLLLSFISPSISSFFENEKIHYSLLAYSNFVGHVLIFKI